MGGKSSYQRNMCIRTLCAAQILEGGLEGLSYGFIVLFIQCIMQLRNELILFRLLLMPRSVYIVHSTVYGQFNKSLTYSWWKFVLVLGWTQRQFPWPRCYIEIAHGQLKTKRKRISSLFFAGLSHFAHLPWPAFITDLHTNLTFSVEMPVPCLRKYGKKHLFNGRACERYDTLMGSTTMKNGILISRHACNALAATTKSQHIQRERPNQRWSIMHSWNLSPNLHPTVCINVWPFNWFLSIDLYLFGWSGQRARK